MYRKYSINGTTITAANAIPSKTLATFPFCTLLSHLSPDSYNLSQDHPAFITTHSCYSLLLLLRYFPHNYPQKLLNNLKLLGSLLS